MQISEKTRCWICDRNAKELKEAVETYWESGELKKDMDLGAYLKTVDLEKVLSRETMPIPICTICNQIMLQLLRDYLRENLKIAVKL